jgi:nucleoside-diphosphate kinase
VAAPADRAAPAVAASQAVPGLLPAARASVADPATRTPVRGASRVKIADFALAAKSVYFFQQKAIAMAIERTLSIIKPDAVAKNVIGQIYARFEGAGLKVVAARMAHLSRGEAEAFYSVHKERPFFKDLVDFMVSGPVMIQVLEGDNAILKNRDLMGATDPKKAAAGTIRADFADSIDANAVHGSDGPDTARHEVGFFFAGMNVYTR